MWQDKILWKHFHLTYLGGNPRPPLLPKAWMKSAKFNLIQLRSRKTPLDKLTFAIMQGLHVIVDQLLDENPNFFFPMQLRADTMRKWAFRHFDFGDLHPMEIVANHSDDYHLDVLKVVWNRFEESKTRDPHRVEEYREHMRYKAFHVALNLEDAYKRAAEICVEGTLRRGCASMLRFVLSVSPFAKQYVTNYWSPLCEYTNAFQVCPPELMALLEELGAIFNSRNLVEAATNSPLALWLLGRVKSWKGEPYAFLRAIWKPSTNGTVAQKRALVKAVLQQTPDKLTSERLKDCARADQVDKKILKWLLRRVEAKMGEKVNDLPLWCTPLYRGDVDFLHFLVKIDAVNMDHVGGALLVHAVEFNHLPMIKALLAYGADPRGQVTNEPYTTLGLANQRGQNDVRELLLNAIRKKKKEETAQSKKRKRQPEKEEEKNHEENNGEVPGEKESEPKKRKGSAREKKQKEPPKLSEEKMAEKKMEERICEQLKWICDTDSTATTTLREVVIAREKGFSVFTLKMVCRKWKLHSPSARRSDLLQTVIQFLEDRQALAQAEL